MKLLRILSRRWSTIDPTVPVIVKGASAYFAANCVASLAPFAISLLVSRYLGKEALGLFSVCFALVLAGVLISDLGLNSFIMREFAGTRIHAEVSLRSLLAVRFAASLVAALGIGSATVVLVATADSMLLATTAFGLILLRSVAGALENLIKARMYRMTHVLITIGGGAAHVVSLYAVLSEGFGIDRVFLAMTGVELAKILILFVVTKRDLLPSSSSQGSEDRKVKLILVQGLPFAVIGVLTLLNERIGLFILSWFNGTGEAGIFSAADRFMMVGMLLDSSLLGSAFPIFSLLRKRISLDKVTRQALLVVLLVAIPGSIGLYAIAPWLIDLTFRFPESIQLLRILSLSLPPIIFNSIIRTALFSMRRERGVAFAFGMCSLLNIVLCVVFIPHFGATAAAFVAVIVEYCLSGVYGLLYFRSIAAH